MKKKSLRMVIVLLLFAIMLVPFSEMETYAATTKPAQVKGLKKVGEKVYFQGPRKLGPEGFLMGRNVSSVKIKFKKVKGATGYQVLIYQGKAKGFKTPLVYAKNTKKTTYTIKNLVPSTIHTIKVRAYTKGKNGKIVYGKTTSIKVKTSGKMKGQYYTCGTCIVSMPGNMNRITEHGESVDRVHHELHAGGSYFWK